MKLDEIVAWYQKKIGTYDKQQWEKTVEQRILSGFTQVPLKNTKLKTELIDVDLVRGSSFPKAKPKQSLLTVLRLAVLRLILLPLYAKWWVQQTSPKVFAFLLFLYLLQMFNWSVYSYNVNKTKSSADNEHIVHISELTITMALSLVLSAIHSQIVATASSSGSNEKRKQRLLHPTRKYRERVRRRKKAARSRVSSNGVGVGVTTNNLLNHDSDPKVINSLNSGKRLSAKDLASNHHHKNHFIFDNRHHPNCEGNSSGDKYDQYNLSCDISSLESTKSDLNKLLPNVETLNLRKRNVNWDSPIKSQFSVTSFDHNPYKTDDNNDIRFFEEYVCQIENSTTIENSVHEFINDLIETVESQEDNHNENANGDNFNLNVSEQTGEDDGFESLNGKSSSGEDNPNIDVNLEIEPNLENTVPLQINQKLPFRNARVKDVFENIISGPLSDSDTDTLKGSNPTIRSRKNSLTLNLPFSLSKSSKRNPPLSSESEFDFSRKAKILTNTDLLLNHQKMTPSSTTKMFKNGSLINLKPVITNINNNKNKLDSSDTDEEGDDGETVSTPGTCSNLNFTEGTTSATEWIGVTTNSEECSYSSELDQSDSQNELSENFEYDFTPTVILNPTCGANDRISCTIWDRRETKKAEMSVLDISSAIIERVEAMPETCDYIYIGVAFSFLLSLIPAICRICEAAIDSTNSTAEINFLDVPVLLLETSSEFSSITILHYAFGETSWEKTVLIISFAQRLCLTFLFFFLLAVAERTFKQRFLYAKLFSHLTSSRRARKSELPHFRLNKVRNIKTWLSVRSYLKRRGPQRSVDVIVSAAFILTLLLLAFLSVEWLKDSPYLHTQYNIEALIWSSALGTFLLRFMTLGTKINRKYRSISVLITEQINLYLQIEQKPHKKEELMVSNSVLKLAADLLKELESPFKISGLSANPLLYTTVKVVILSALSGVLSEMLGFKLKLHKIKIK